MNAAIRFNYRSGAFHYQINLGEKIMRAQSPVLSISRDLSRKDYGNGTSVSIHISVPIDESQVTEEGILALAVQLSGIMDVTLPVLMDEAVNSERAWSERAGGHNAR